MRLSLFTFGLFVATALQPALAQGSGSNPLRIIEEVTVRNGWAFASDDAYLGTRAGCFEGLTKVDFDNKLQPLLAISWTNTSPTTWEFRLRENVRFQDGSSLNAQTAANALNNLLKAELPARAFSPKLIKSVEAVGDNVVKITTVEPSVLLPLQLASPATTILSPAAYKDGKVDPIGTCTGPFIITEVDPAQRMAVKRNDKYWGEKPALTGALIRFNIDANSRATQIRTGEADIARVVPLTMLTRLKSTPGTQLSQVNAPRTTMLLLNNKKAPLTDVRVRRAIQAAINVAGLAASVYEGAVQPAAGPFVPTDPWAPKDVKPAYDLTKAKTLLEEAGIKPGMLKLGLLGYTRKTELKDVAAVVQDQLKAIGVDVDVRIADYNAIEPDMISGNYDMALMSRGYLTDVAEPAGYLNADYGCSGSFNMSHYCDPEVDAEIKKVFSSRDPQERAAMYSQIAKKVYDEAATVFLVHETLHDAYSSKLTNFRSHPLNYYMLTPSLSIQ